MSSKETGKAFIEHFGVRGMRWGVRRSSGGVSGGKKAKGKGDGDAPKKVVGKTNTKGKSASDMSDVQLRRVNNRLNMEKQYKDLTKVPPGKIDAAKSFVTGIALNVARTQMTNVANDLASQAIGEAMAGRNLKLPKNADPTKPFKFPAPAGKKFL